MLRKTTLERCIVLTAATLLSAATPIFAADPVIGQWEIHESADPITDKRIVTTATGTEDGMALLFQCSGTAFGAVISPLMPRVAMEFVTMEKTADVAWRIDSRPAVSERWHVLPGKAGSAYSVVSLSPNRLASAIISGGSKITFRVHGLTTSATLAGASNHVTKTLQACGLKP